MRCSCSLPTCYLLGGHTTSLLGSVFHLVPRCSPNLKPATNNRHKIKVAIVQDEHDLVSTKRCIEKMQPLVPMVYRTLYAQGCAAAVAMTDGC